MSKKRFLSIILSAIIALTTVASVNVFAAEKTTKYFGWNDGGNSAYTTIVNAGGVSVPSVTEINGRALTANARVVSYNPSSNGRIYVNIGDPVTLAANESVKFSYSVTNVPGDENLVFVIKYFFEGLAADGETTLTSKNGVYQSKSGGLSPMSGDVADWETDYFHTEAAAVSGSWTDFEVVLSRDASSKLNLLMYKNGVRVLEINDYLSAVGMTEINRMSMYIWKSSKANYLIDNIKFDYYPAATAEKGLVVKSEGFVKDEGTASAALENYSLESRNASLVIASYNADGSLADISFKSAALAPRLEKTIEAEIADYSGKTVKAFLWDNLTSLTPLASAK